MPKDNTTIVPPRVIGESESVRFFKDQNDKVIPKIIKELKKRREGSSPTKSDITRMGIDQLAKDLGIQTD